jgi:hypothetical protein
MKKIHTAMRRSMGNQDTSTPSSDGTSSSDGLAVIFTPFWFSLSTRLGSFGA